MKTYSFQEITCVTYENVPAHDTAIPLYNSSLLAYFTCVPIHPQKYATLVQDTFRLPLHLLTSRSYICFH